MTGLTVPIAQEVFRQKNLIQGYDAVIDCARRLVGPLFLSVLHVLFMCLVINLETASWHDR